jgi:hypothetical protein
MAVPFSMILSTHFTGLQQNLGIIASASAALSVASRERECFGRYFPLSRNLLFDSEMRERILLPLVSQCRYWGTRFGTPEGSRQGLTLL